MSQVSGRENALFADLVGQPLAVSLLLAALTQQRLAPAYVFSGPEGVGRRLAVLRFLEGVLCEGQCSSRQRRRLAERNHPDLHWVEPTYSHQGRLISRSEAEEAGVSRRSSPLVRLEQIRDVSRVLARQPLESSRGMVVLEEPEAMAEAAANALLKTLEEPGHGLLILLTAAPERLLPTILSRCQLIRLTRLSSADMQAVLEGLPAESQQDVVRLGLKQPELVAMAGGSPGALIDHVKQWLRVPPDLMGRLMLLPTQPIEAMGLARDLSEALDGEQQLWIIHWLQQNNWSTSKDERRLRKLERLRKKLLGYVQPRLAWELTLLDLMEDLS